jgi:excisionase family DNA binding protein
MPIQRKRIAPVVQTPNSQPEPGPDFRIEPGPVPLLVDINGAAKLLSSTPWTVRGLLWARKIPFIKIGKRFLIDPADLGNFIAREKEGQRAA